MISPNLICGYDSNSYKKNSISSSLSTSANNDSTFDVNDFIISSCSNSNSDSDSNSDSNSDSDSDSFFFRIIMII